MAGLDFAKRQLTKHGWKEGSGLGKQQNGRSEPVKVTLKMDKTGVGHEPGKEFTDHWWLRVFNEAAQKIGKKDKVKKKKKKASEDKNALYKGFVLSSTLTNGIETAKETLDSSSDVDDEAGQSSDISTPTLKEIHQFCGGATGHKAARFGIKMNGKLARVAEQDRMFEEKLRQKLQPAPSVSSVPNTQLKPHQVDGVTSPSLCQTQVVDTSGCTSRKKEKMNSKKKSNHKNEPVEVQIVPLKSKQKLDKSSVIVQEEEGTQDMAAVKTRKRKCAAEQGDDIEKTNDHTTGALYVGSGGSYKKKKKKQK